LKRKRKREVRLSRHGLPSDLPDRTSDEINNNKKPKACENSMRGSEDFSEPRIQNNEILQLKTSTESALLLSHPTPPISSLPRISSLSSSFPPLRMTPTPHELADALKKSGEFDKLRHRLNHEFAGLKDQGQDVRSNGPAREGQDRTLIKNQRTSDQQIKAVVMEDIERSEDCVLEVMLQASER